MKNDRALADLLEALDRELEARQQARARPFHSTAGSSLKTHCPTGPLPGAWVDTRSGVAAPTG